MGDRALQHHLLIWLAIEALTYFKTASDFAVLHD
jgi:hypothetical protein